MRKPERESIDGSTTNESRQSARAFLIIFVALGLTTTLAILSNWFSPWDWRRLLRFGLATTIGAGLLNSLIWSYFLCAFIRPGRVVVDRRERLLLHGLQVSGVLSIVFLFDLHPTLFKSMVVISAVAFAWIASLRLARKSPIGIAGWTGSIGFLAMLVQFARVDLGSYWPSELPFSQWDATGTLVLTCGATAIIEAIIVGVAPQWLIPGHPPRE